MARKPKPEQPPEEGAEQDIEQPPKQVVAIKNNSCNSIEIHHRNGGFIIAKNAITPVGGVPVSDVERLLNKYPWLEAVTE